MKKLLGKIAIDVDNTLQSYGESALAYGQRYAFLKTGEFPTKVNPLGDTTSTIFDWSQAEVAKFWHDDFQYALEKLQPRPLTAQAIRALKKKGFEIYIVSARNDVFHNNPTRATKKWLRKNKMPFDGIFTNIKNKAELCQKLGADIFIDDSPHHLSEVAKTGIRTFAMNSYSNYEIKDKNITRVYSWPHIYYLLTGEMF